MNRALIIGISNYGWLKQDLPGCATDRQEWTAYLTSKLSLSTGAVRVLGEEGATREAILDGVNWILKDAGAGDHRVVFFAGHGARLKRGGAILLEETLVAYPGAVQRPYDDFMIYDADLAEIIDASNFPAQARLTLIFDSCHSGGMLRPLLIQNANREPFDGALPRCLSLPEDSANFLEASFAPFSRTLAALQGGVGATPRLLIAAATTEQSAWDDRMSDGKRHGVFSFYCVQELIKTPGRSITEIISEVGKQIAVRFPQSPQLLGDQDRFDDPLF
jgi:hypothetical protein